DAARVKKLYDDLDTIFVAVQLYSYPGQYLSEDPTHHRIAETLPFDQMAKAHEVIEEGSVRGCVVVSI
ncbi:MAG: hypothetical protein ACPGLW_05695, partial [Luminiphilus sp.]